MPPTPPGPAMQQLSGLDASFLYLETPEMPMHVGALHLYELPPGFKGRYLTAVRQHIASRLAATPVLRRRLWRMPLNIANPAWVDAAPDLRQHVVAVKCRKGATLAELEVEVARLHTQLLDRKRPLWKFHVFEGLAPGPDGSRRVAVYTQLHHAAVDGQAAVALANALLDPTPQPRAPQPRASRRQQVFKLEMTEMLRGVIARQASQVVQLIRGIPATVDTLKTGASRVTLAPRTPFNASVTSRRAFASVTLPLPELRELGRAHGASVNDLVLLVCSSALRRWLAKRRQLPRKSLVAAVPLSLRDPGDTTADNQASMGLVSLGTTIADAGQRLAHIMAASAAMKSSRGPLERMLPSGFPSLGMPWLLEAATALYGRARVAERIPQVANLVISNVPGPPVPLYLAGARMLTNYPTSIVVHGLALNITVQSYHQSLDFGLMADAQALPEVAELAEGIRIALDDLRAMPRPGDPDHHATPPARSLVDRAQRVVGGVIGAAVDRMVKGAMDKVGQAVVSGAVDAARAQVRPRRKPAARQSVSREPRERR